MILQGSTIYSAAERRKQLEALSHDERLERLEDELLRYIKHVANSSGVLDTKVISNIFSTYKGEWDDL